MGIYAQFVPEGQRRAVEQMNEYVKKSILEAGTETCHSIGTINRVKMTHTFCKSAAKWLESMVELVGIEPTTSSLRTMRSPS